MFTAVINIDLPEFKWKTILYSTNQTSMDTLQRCKRILVIKKRRGNDAFYTVRICCICKRKNADVIINIGNYIKMRLSSS